MTAEKKRIWGWFAFDWAAQPYYTLGLTFIFGPYFAGVATDFFTASGMSEDAADARAQSVWANAQLVAGLFIAALGPVIGAYADSTGRRMPWIIAFSVVYVVASASLWYMVPDGSALWFCLYAFAIGFVAAEFALIFVNAQLPGLGDEDTIGKISGIGASLGYWGGVVSLFIMLLFFFEANPEAGTTLIGLAPALGLDASQSEGTRFVGPFIAGWFVLFMIPYFAWVREPKPTVKQGGFSAAMADLRASLAQVLRRPSLAAYLGSSMLYRDALNALYGFGGVYARLVLDWSLTNIAIFGIIGAITAAIATWVGGLFDEKYGPKPVIRVCIFILIVVCSVIVGMSRETFFGMALAPGSSLPDITFFVCGAAIGGAGGALYAASRSMMVRHTNPDRPTEAFGLFALSGKATAFLAPLLISVVTTATENARLGISPLIGLFVLALIVLIWVNPKGDRAE
ncbi:MFS transporter [uncultured Roseobacter sp.]|uniref:MFS transporter n=1 Tax=uncultured Roseobacter sp. TaxID=114847 RepID=UPI0026263EC4|nr:MFS transporter [uncultured Roseobacter sp.]